MRRFTRVFSEPVQIIGGPKTRAVVHRPPDIDQPGAEFSYPSLTCRVKPKSLIDAGQVLRLQSGDHYLVADHSATVDWTTFHLFRCDRQVAWARPNTAIDRLTGQQKAAPPLALGTLWVMWEKVRREFTDLSLRVANERHLVATGADVLVGDTITGLTVDRVNQALGVKVVELKG